MKRAYVGLLVSLGLLVASSAGAVTSDHLQCFKIKKDKAALKQTYVATLTPGDPIFGAAPGCQIKTPAKMYCVDTTKTAVTPPPPGAPDGIPAQSYLCYAVKCDTNLPDFTASDQFGSHQVTTSKTSLLCAPVNTAATTTTTLPTGCAVPADCPGADTDCQTRTCVASTCGTAFTANGTPTGSQVSGDCLQNVCDGSGGTISVPQNADVPADDGNQCTFDQCTAGMPGHPFKANGTACAQGGGVVCINGTCVGLCGDGQVGAGEACDDGNAANGDGCSSSCTTESGYQCAGSPSVCTTVCGDGVVAGVESCDDGNAANGDGCSGSCSVELGYNCAGSPSTCATTCGDGIIVGGEGCDDNNLMNGDGCSSSCTVEPGFNCSGQPSICF